MQFNCRLTNLGSIRKFYTQCATNEGRHHWETLSIYYAEVREENNLNFYRLWNTNSQKAKIILGFGSYSTDPFKIRLMLPQIGNTSAVNSAISDA